MHHNHDSRVACTGNISRLVVIDSCCKAISNACECILCAYAYLVSHLFLFRFCAARLSYAHNICAQSWVVFAATKLSAEWKECNFLLDAVLLTYISSSTDLCASKLQTVYKAKHI